VDLLAVQHPFRGARYTRAVQGPLQVRRPTLELSADVPRWWYGGDAFATHCLDALSSVFPDGEAFFVRSVLHYRGRIDDPALQRAVQGFAGQEAQHGHHHDRHLELLEAHGYGALGRMNRLMDRAMRLQNRWLPRVSLAGTASAEHLTALLARRILERSSEFTRPMDPRMAELWRWHALEEAEHKSVAYDVLMRVAPGYALRVAMLVATTLGLFAETFARTAYMLWKDGVLFERATWRSAAAFLFARGGLLRGHGPAYLAWFRRDFHPTRNDDSALIEAWRERFA
jgi:predicted metal-dependent hydrolase